MDTTPKNGDLRIDKNSITSFELPTRKADASVSSLIFNKSAGLLSGTLFSKHYPTTPEYEVEHADHEAKDGTFLRGLSVKLTLGAHIYRCDDSEIFEAFVEQDGSDPRLIDITATLPPLMVKISNRKRSHRVGFDAYMYERMHTQQGVCIPRCYGYFVAEVPPDTAFRADDSHIHRDFEGSWTELPKPPRQVDQPLPYVHSSFLAPLENWSWTGNPSTHDFLRDMPSYPYTTYTVSVLLLERYEIWNPSVATLSPGIIRALFLDVCSWAICIEHGEADEHCHHFVRPLQRIGDEDAMCKRHGVRHELLLADFDYAWLSNEPVEESAEYFYDELWFPRFS